jgi:hypothetical protein
MRSKAAGRDSDTANSRLKPAMRPGKGSGRPWQKEIAVVRFVHNPAANRFSRNSMKFEVFPFRILAPFVTKTPTDGRRDRRNALLYISFMKSS